MSERYRKLADIVKNGAGVGKMVDGVVLHLSSIVLCNDGFEMSVIANKFAYSTPRKSHGPYTHVEVGFPTQCPSPWSKWEKYCEDPDSHTETVYSYVPVQLVQDLIELHGGEVDDPNKPVRSQQRSDNQSSGSTEPAGTPGTDDEVIEGSLSSLVRRTIGSD